MYILCLQVQNVQENFAYMLKNLEKHIEKVTI
jgi:hypothetical protein